MIRSSLSNISKSPTRDQPQQLTKGSIYAKQGLNYWIIIKKLIFCSIGLGSIIIYGLSIVKQSYEYQRLNVSTQFQSSNISEIS